MNSARWVLTTLAGSALALLASCGSNDDSSEVAATPVAPQTPILDSWQTKLSGRYARVLETQTTFPVRTWPAAGLTDTSGAAPLATYSDVQLVRHEPAKLPGQQPVTMMASRPKPGPGSSAAVAV